MSRWLKIVLVVAAVSSAGCAQLHAELARDRRDAPWDPRGSRSLMDQIPAWDGAANRVCGGHLTEEERQRTGRSPRC
jgi:hypothetical protein